MNILRSLQSDMLSLNKIVDDRRAWQPVITTGGMTASLEMAARTEEIPSTESPDGFELALAMLPPVLEVTWAGSPEVVGWRKVVRWFRCLWRGGKDTGATESTPESGAQVEEDQPEGSTRLDQDLATFVAPTLEQRMEICGQE
ncbi:hypothetical protein F511_41973 [Dorcoceras hygrometricum]|uniref:Uncharacterized protein n=1 Tax=Dorcoceras hygrometricum TaxID=472368 RepID=A0A2Z7B3X7_9LAMI|nr:hypothetical protein F511_41973 [Dorcoceras hygrometricum]